MTRLASLDDAHEYFQHLPLQLDKYLDDSCRKSFQNLMLALEQFFDVTATVNYQALENQLITHGEASNIGEHGFIQLLRLITLMEKLGLHNKRKELEQISLVFARWVIRYNGRLNHIEPVVNGCAQAANTMQDKDSLIELVEFMNRIVRACADEIKYDLETSNLYRPWRLLHINRSIVATRTHDINIMRRVFDEMIFSLPLDATSFFVEGMKEAEKMDYPANVRQLIKDYRLLEPKIKPH